MAGTDILRRDEIDGSSNAMIAKDRRDARRSAFEANLALQLEKTLGGEASLKEISEITRVLGAAYHSTQHAVDARTAIRFGIRRYFVLQAGVAPKTGDHRIDQMDPFAAKLISRLKPGGTQIVEPRLRAIGEALSKAEIAFRHPLDWRLRLSTPWFRLYATVLSGRDRRRNANGVSHERRTPVNESVGLLVLLTIVAILALLGAGLILTTLWALSDLLANEAGRSSLQMFLHNSLSALGMTMTP